MELGGAVGNELTEPADHEMHLIRQEFEANLLEAGLEIERDREVSVTVLMHIFYFLMLYYYVLMQLRVMILVRTLLLADININNILVENC